MEAIQVDRQMIQDPLAQSRREKVFRYLERVVPGMESWQVLEIGPESLWLSDWLLRKGHETALVQPDASKLKHLHRAARQHETRPSIGLLKAAPEDLPGLLKGRRFDLIFFHEGYISQLTPEALNLLPEVVHNLLNPGGKLLLTMRPAFCLSEALYFLLRLQFYSAFRRMLADPAPYEYRGTALEEWFYRPSRMRRIFRRLKYSRKLPVGMFLPSAETGLQAKFFLPVLRLLERSIGGWAAFGGLSDHCLLEFRRIEY